jgi:S-(hydroxymethyl)glutathione dehydrogenase/alcohol dehydrogenase
MMTLAGGMISDGTYRYHLAGENVNRMAQLGTFADEMVCHENSVVRINPWDNMKAAALISCGIATGFGSAVDRAKVKPGETVVVAGCGGVGSGAIQGARIAGARHIIAVDPTPFKLEKAKAIGATHTAASLAEVPFLLPELTMGRNADVVILTPGVLHGEMIAEAAQCGSKDARIVVTAISPFSAMDVQLNLFNLAMFNQSVLGTVFGSQSPRVQVPNLLNLFEAGQLKIDELITQEYTLDQVQQGYDDQAAGTIIRGVVKYDS